MFIKASGNLLAINGTCDGLRLVRFSLIFRARLFCT